MIYVVKSPCWLTCRKHASTECNKITCTGVSEKDIFQMGYDAFSETPVQIILLHSVSGQSGTKFLDELQYELCHVNLDIVSYRYRGLQTCQ